MTKQKFLNPEKVLHAVALDKNMTVADMGSGNGFFPVPAAKIIGDQGQVWAVDILEEALGNLISLARLEGRNNILTQQCDLDSQEPCNIPELSCDLVIVGKILTQMKSPQYLANEAYRILKTGGKLLVLEWKKESSVLGPPLGQRIGMEDAKKIFTTQAFKYSGEIETDPFHYGLVFQK